MEPASPKVSQQPTNYSHIDDRETATTATHGTTGERHPLMVGRWETSLFSCGDDIVPNCLMSFFCPWVSFAQILARVGVSQYYPTVLILVICYFSWVGAILAFLFMFYFRYKLRRELNIHGTIYQDCAVAFCCCCCSLAQMATHTHSYTKGLCSFEPKETLPGYSNMLTQQDSPLRSEHQQQTGTTFQSRQYHQGVPGTRQFYQTQAHQQPTSHPSQQGSNYQPPSSYPSQPHQQSTSYPSQPYQHPSESQSQQHHQSSTSQQPEQPHSFESQPPRLLPSDRQDSRQQPRSSQSQPPPRLQPSDQDSHQQSSASQSQPHQQSNGSQAQPPRLLPSDRQDSHQADTTGQTQQQNQPGSSVDHPWLGSGMNRSKRNNDTA